MTVGITGDLGIDHERLRDRQFDTEARDVAGTASSAQRICLCRSEPRGRLTLQIKDTRPASRYSTENKEEH
jgi:hypothetical protein